MLRATCDCVHDESLRCLLVKPQSTIFLCVIFLSSVQLLCIIVMVCMVLIQFFELKRCLGEIGFVSEFEDWKTKAKENLTGPAMDFT